MNTTLPMATWPLTDSERQTYQRYYELAKDAGRIMPGFLHFDDAARVRAAITAAGAIALVQFDRYTGTVRVTAKVQDARTGNAAVSDVDEPTYEAVAATLDKITAQLATATKTTRNRMRAEREAGR